MQICSLYTIRLLTIVGFLCGTAGLTCPTQAQTTEEQTMQAAASVLDEIMAIPAKGIPSALLAEAEGVAIIPNVIKGGFIVGARYGNGVLVVKENGFWRAPVFITLTGGNVGWQAGVQATDIVLVFKTQKSIQGILSGTFTLGVDAAAAAGPVGRQASAATDAGLKSEIYSYSRSRGIFAGVSFDGSALTVNQFANAAYYQQAGSGTVPPSARVVVDKIIAYSQPQAAPNAKPTAQAPPLNPHATANVNEVEMVRRQLAQTAPELYEVLPPEWQAFLGLPREIFTGGSAPSAEALQQSLNRFATVSSDPQFRSLAEQPKFQSTYGLLRHYAHATQQESNTISLPPPPVTPGSAGY
jgi:lipid-binding SYLF domain-containing protein